MADNGILFLGSIMTGAINYALYPVISRFITTQQFGEVQILISLMAQLAIFSQVLRIFVVNTLKEETKKDAIAQFLRNTSRTLLLITAGIGLFSLALAPLISNTLQFENWWPLVPTVVAVIAGLQFVLPVSYMQSRQRFDRVALLQFSQALFKLVLAASAGWLGFGSTGIMAGVALAAIYNAWQARKHLDIAPSQGSTKAKFAGTALRAHANYIVLISLSLLSVLVLMSLDTFFVKEAFDPDTAGLYAGIAVVARTLFFLTASFSAVMISKVKPSQSMQSNIRNYTGSLGLMALIGGSGLLVMWAVPGTVTRILLGDIYVQYAHLLPRLSLALGLLGIINIIVNFHVALRERYIIGPILAGLAITTALLVANNESLESIASHFASGIAITLGLCAAWTITWCLRNQNS